MGKARDLASLLNASGQITSSKIGDGEVSATDLANTLNLVGKTVTLPPSIASKVLQIRWITQQTTETTINSGSVFNFATLSITPQSNSSTIMVFGNPQFYTRQVDGGTSGQGNGQVQIQDITNSNIVTIQEWVNYSDVGSTHGLRQKHAHIAFFSNNITTQREFRFRYNQASGVGRIGGDTNITTTLAIEFV